jgi:hypothetical protein
MSRSRPVPDRRLVTQQIARPAASPAEVVAWLGAVQAQDYPASLWAVGLRTRRATAATIEAAIAEGSIVRTHVFRGTWQYVARDDLRWMLALVGERVIARLMVYCRQLGLDEPMLRRSSDALRAATRGAQLTRAEVAAALEASGIRTEGPLLRCMIGRAELDGVVCGGARRGKQQTFASFEERIPAAPAVPRERALGELARRFFQSRGPATLRDFVWWSGLPVGDARAGLAAIAGDVEAEVIGGVEYWSARGGAGRRSGMAYLLPAFDEYLVGYCDRRDVLHPDHVRAINAGGGLLSACVVVDGRVAGVWRRTLDKAGLAIEISWLTRTTRAARAAVAEAAERYARFLATPLARLTGAG